MILKNYYAQVGLTCVFILVSLLHNRVVAQNEFFTKSNRALKNGNRLLAVDMMEKAIKHQPEMASVLTQALPLVSDYSPVCPFDDVKVGNRRNPDHIDNINQRISEYHRKPAIQAIVELAKDRRVVILNEAHDCPQHRAFGLQVARALREAGFTHMAMETLRSPTGKSGKVTFKYPTLNTGHYTAEPVFGDFVRQTNRLGYQMIAYEIEMSQRKNTDPSDHVASIIERENAQSDNLIRTVIEQDPNSRVFVFVGYSHATEDWTKSVDGREIGWMAAQLKKKTGIDPLTIDQVGGSYNPKSKTVDAVFAEVEKHESLTIPSVLTSGENDWLRSDSYHNKVDLTVFHPVQKMIDGRPDWLRMNGYRKPFKIKNETVFINDKTLVQAFLQDEGDNGLPVDQVLVTSAEGESTFLLPAGKYRTQSITIDGAIKKGPDFNLD